ncbi:MAG: transposase [Nitrosomonas sp.]
MRLCRRLFQPQLSRLVCQIKFRSGQIKRLFKMRRTSYFGTVKVNAQVILKSICMNLKKAANKIFVDKPAWRAVRPNVA